MENFGHFFMLALGLASGIGMGYWYWGRRGKKMLEEEYFETRDALVFTFKERARALEEELKQLRDKVKDKL